MNNTETKKYKITTISEIYDLSDEMQQLAKETKMFNIEAIKAIVSIFTELTAGAVVMPYSRMMGQYEIIALIFCVILIGASSLSLIASITKLRNLYCKTVHELQEKNGANEVVARINELGNDAYQSTLIDDYYEDEENDLGGKTR